MTKQTEESMVVMLNEKGEFAFRILQSTNIGFYTLLPVLQSTFNTQDSVKSLIQYSHNPRADWRSNHDRFTKLESLLNYDYDIQFIYLWFKGQWHILISECNTNPHGREDIVARIKNLYKSNAPIILPENCGDVEELAAELANTYKVNQAKAEESKRVPTTYVTYNVVLATPLYVTLTSEEEMLGIEHSIANKIKEYGVENLKLKAMQQDRIYLECPRCGSSVLAKVNVTHTCLIDVNESICGRGISNTEDIESAIKSQACATASGCGSNAEIYYYDCIEGCAEVESNSIDQFVIPVLQPSL